MKNSQLKELIKKEFRLLTEAKHDIYTVVDNTTFGWRIMAMYEDPEHALQLLRSGEGQYGKLTKSATVYGMGINKDSGGSAYATLSWPEKKWRKPGSKVNAPKILYAFYNRKAGWPLEGIFTDPKKLGELWKKVAVTYPGKPSNAPVDKWLNQGGKSKVDDSSLIVLKYKVNAAGTEKPKNISKTFRGKTR